jgi:hypothetical protein
MLLSLENIMPKISVAEVPDPILNEAAFKETLAAALAPYELDLATAEMSVLKEKKATLSRLRRVLDEKRKGIKALYAQPYLAFERKIKEIFEMIDKPLNAISEKVSAHEAEVEKAKLGRIEEAFNDMFVKYPEVKWNDVKKEQWGNKTYKYETIEAELVTMLHEVETGKKLLIDDALNEKYTPQGLKELYRTCDIAAALAVIRKLNAEDEEMLRQERINKAQSQEEEKITINLSITGTKAELVGVLGYIKGKGLKYTKMEKEEK